MKITGKRKLLIERERTVVIRFGDGAAQSICPVCGESRFVSVEEAALLRQTSASEISLLIEANQIHRVETVEGSTFICLASLLKSIEVSESKTLKKTKGKLRP